jgi:prepilin-type N-terminal cleavage/methylation domain-containing protein
MRRAIYKKGFTLVELLLAMALISVVTGIGVAVISTIIRSSTKASITNMVKQNGDSAIETISRSVRSAVDVCAAEVGTNTGNYTIKLYPSKIDPCSAASIGTIGQFSCTKGASGANGSITKDGQPLTNVGPTGKPQLGVKVTYCEFVASNTHPKRVKIKFILEQGDGLGSTPDTTSKETFETEVTLRNF